MCSPSAKECTSCITLPTLAPVDSTYRPVSTCIGSEFACWNGRDSVEDGCITADDVCDKVNDCGDNSDENGCPDSASDCKRNEFACLGGAFQDLILRFACIDMDYVCDGNNDCGDHTDEIGCPYIPPVTARSNLVDDKDQGLGTSQCCLWGFPLWLIAPIFILGSLVWCWCDCDSD